MVVMFILSLLEFPMETSGQIFALLSSLLLLTFPRNTREDQADAGAYIFFQFWEHWIPLRLDL